MNIASTTVINTAFETTRNGRYKIEYSEIDGYLNKVSIAIHRLDDEPLSDQNYIGSISLDQGYFVCQIPTGYSISPFFIDADQIISALGKIDEPLMTQTNNFGK